MKFIEKGSKPQELEEWQTRKHYTKEKLERIVDWDKKNKRKKVWTDFTKTGTRGVNGVTKNALNNEQGGICCYCQDRLIASEIQIEHLKSRKHSPSKMFEYEENMILCCLGGEKDPQPKDVHCGANKKDDNISINPLQTDCESKFRYAEDGSIYSSDVNAEDTISKLNLDCIKLTNRRKIAINAFLDGYVSEDLTHDDLQQLITFLQHKDEYGNFQPFCQVIESVLNS